MSELHTQFYRKQSVTVTGKSMKLKDLGELDPQRADNPINRNVNASGGGGKAGYFRSVVGVINP